MKNKPKPRTIIHARCGTKLPASGHDGPQWWWCPSCDTVFHRLNAKRTRKTK